MQQLRLLLCEWDPIHVAEHLGVCDEYDCLMGGIFSILRRNGSAQELEEFLHSEFANHFGMEAPNVTQFVEKVFERFKSEKSA